MVNVHVVTVHATKSLFHEGWGWGGFESAFNVFFDHIETQ
jgi:hypothetical protein